MLLWVWFEKNDSKVFKKNNYSAKRHKKKKKYGGITKTEDCEQERGD